MWKIWHNLIIKFDKNKDALFMNYGYQSLNGDPKLELEENDEINRYCIQLYDFVVNKVEIKDKDVLEVGSGRGGGASYISRYYKPKTYTAIDISPGVIKFCNKHHTVDGLKFVTGVAEAPPFAAGSFDVVVNVESARCYRSMKKFFEEAHRVLKTDGHFCFADMVKAGEYESIKEQLLNSGFELIEEQEIGANVVKALDRDHEHRQSAIAKNIPGFLQKSFQEFAGTKGTGRYDSFASGKMQYWRLVSRKK